MLLAGGLAAVPIAVGDNDAPDGHIVQFGKMREAVGQKQDEGRVRFSELLKRPHFYGVAALEGLHGEATIYDGKLTTTTVDSSGRLRTSESSGPDQQATLLVGAYVASWAEHTVAEDVGAEKFDKYIADTAAMGGMNINKPFMFAVEGEFSDVRWHVINGACPIHARINKIELPKEVKPFESEMPNVRGTLVGVFAKDSVGILTHPATSTHSHLLLRDPVSGKLVTGHVEQIELRKGARLRLPESESRLPQ